MSRRYIYFGSFASAAYFTDLFGVPKVAYALRKLSPNTLYSGAAIRVRRSSDNTEQDINFTSSAVNAPLDTSALTSFVGANDGFVTTWYDQSGNGIDISQSTASNQPKIVNAGSVITMNSKTSISFASASNGNFLQTTSNNHFQSSILDIYSVMKVVSYSGFGTVFWGSTTSVVYWQLGLTNRFNIQGGTQFVGLSVNDGLQRLINMFVSGSNTKTITYNNSSNYTGTETPTTISSSNQVFTLGRWMGGTSWNLDGDIQEFIVFGTNQTTNKSNIKTDINTYYNVF